jgi:hypothetical protein
MAMRAKAHLEGIDMPTSVACRKTYITDEAWQTIKSAIKDKATAAVADAERPDGAIRLYIDDGAGTHLDTIDLYKKSQEPAIH